MRPLAALAVALAVAGPALTQDKPVPARFDVLHNPELYPQGTPQEALASVLGAVSRERYDYLVAHLLDPEFVDGRVAAFQPYFDRVAGEQITATGAGAALKGPDLDRRVREVGTRLNVKHLAEQVRLKLADEPDNLKELKRFAREAEFKEAGDTAAATLKDVKDRALYFKKVGGRWFLENRKDERPPAKE